MLKKCMAVLLALVLIMTMMPAQAFAAETADTHTHEGETGGRHGCTSESKIHQDQLIESAAPTCDTDGSKTYQCSVCKDTYKVRIPALGGEHQFGPNEYDFHKECGKDSYVINTCIRCGTQRKERIAYGDAHKWAQIRVSYPNGCEAPGQALVQCQSCGTQETQTVKATKHSWTRIGLTYPKTCDKGLETVKCTTCGEVAYNDGPSRSHNWVKVGNPVKKNCVTSTQAYKCSQCSETKTEKVAIAGAQHTWDSVTKTIYPNGCLEKGQVIQTCKVCGETSVKEEAPKRTKHEVNKAQKTSKEDCTAKTYEQTCKICGQTVVTKYTNPKKTHNFKGKVTVVDTVCGELGYTETKCTRCNVTKKVYDTDENHAWVETITYPDGCLAAGKLTKVCSGCGATEESVVGPREGGHDFEKQEEVKAICGKDGFVTYKCTVCGETKTDVLKAPAKYHSMDYLHAHKEGDCLTGVYVVVTCRTCGFESRNCYIQPRKSHLHLTSYTKEGEGCLEPSYTYSLCLACGFQEKTESASAPGHDMVSLGKTYPNCTDPGTETFQCSRCEEETTESIDPRGHLLDDILAQDAEDCTKTSYQRICQHEDCGAAVDTNYSNPQKFHALKLESVTKPGFFSKGAITVKCQNCNFEKTEEFGLLDVSKIQKLYPELVEKIKELCPELEKYFPDHIWGKPYSEEGDGCEVISYTCRKCWICGEVEKTVSEEGPGHDLDEVLTHNPDDCTDATGYQRTCNREGCDYAEDTNYSDPQNYHILKLEVVSIPGYNRKGAVKVHCQNCNYEKTEEFALKDLAQLKEKYPEFVEKALDKIKDQYPEFTEEALDKIKELYPEYAEKALEKIKELYPELTEEALEKIKDRYPELADKIKDLYSELQKHCRHYIYGKSYSEAGDGCEVISYTCKKCLICGHVEKTEVEGPGHIFDEILAMDAEDCTKTSYQRTCKREGCGAVVDTEYTNYQPAHILKLKEVTLPESGKNGKITVKCQNCAFEKTEEIALKDLGEIKEKYPEFAEEALNKIKELYPKLTEKVLEKIKDLYPELTEDLWNKIKDQYPELTSDILGKIKDLYPELEEEVLNEFKKLYPKLTKEALNKIKELYPELTEDLWNKIKDQYPELTSDILGKIKDLYPELEEEVLNEFKKLYPKLTEEALNKIKDLYPELTDDIWNKIKDQYPGLTDEVLGKIKDLYPELEEKILDEFKDLYPKLTEEALNKIKDLYPELTEKILKKIKDLYPEIENHCKFHIWGDSYTEPGEDCKVNTYTCKKCLICGEVERTVLEKGPGHDLELGEFTLPEGDKSGTITIKCKNCAFVMSEEIALGELKEKYPEYAEDALNMIKELYPGLSKDALDQIIEVYPELKDAFLDQIRDQYPTLTPEALNKIKDLYPELTADVLEKIKDLYPNMTADVLNKIKDLYPGASDNILGQLKDLYPELQKYCPHPYCKTYSEAGDGCEVISVKYKKCVLCGHVEEVGSEKGPGHTYGDWETVKEATCVAPGEKTRTCQKKGCTSVENGTIAALGEAGHKYGETWTTVKEPTCVATGEKTRACKNDGCTHVDKATIAALGKEGHKYGDWETVKEATCVAGEKIRKCQNTGCNSVESETINASGDSGHKYEENKWTVTKEATCVAAGEKTRPCINEGCTHIETQTIDALGESGHKYEENKWTTTKEATCVAVGEKTRPCINEGCTHIETQTIDALGESGHKYGETWATVKEPTCVATGEKTRACKNDGCTHVDKATIAALGKEGHKYGDWETVKEATCVAAGEKTRTCINDGCTHVDKKTILAHGHRLEITSFTKPTITINGVKDGAISIRCTECTDVKIEESISLRNLGDVMDRYSDLLAAFNSKK